MSYMCSLSFFFSSRRRHTRSTRDWSSDVCSSDLGEVLEHRRDAMASRGAWPGKGDRRAADQEFAFVWRKNPVEDLDQRRLTRAVVAQQAGDLARQDLERDVL